MAIAMFLFEKVLKIWLSMYFKLRFADIKDFN